MKGRRRAVHYITSNHTRQGNCNDITTYPIAMAHIKLRYMLLLDWGLS